MRRNIPDRLFEIFENRLAHSNQAANCIINNDARGLLVEAARAMIHLQETDGENRSAEIDMMHRVTGVGMGEPWCMSFVQSCLACRAPGWRRLAAHFECRVCDGVELES
jgi:hypothetical protein